MNYRQKYLSCLLGIAALVGGASTAFAAGAPSLGTASDFAVLSVGTGTVTPTPSPDPTAAVTLTRTTVTGNVGSAGAVTLTNSTINGNLVRSGDLTNTTSTIFGTNTQPLPAQVITDFNAEYNRLALQSCDTVLTTLPTTPLAPGVYCFNAALTAVTGSTLTLVGGSNATWLFKIGTGAAGALTGTDFSVVMDGGGDACNVTWWVDAAASMTRGAFKGTILAGAAITFDGTVVTAGDPPITTFTGGALAKAEVTLSDVALVGCEAGGRGGNAKSKCNQGVGNGPEDCDPGNSNQDGHGSNPFDGSLRTNDELGGVPGNPGRKDGNK